jgi:hypothetical protein
VVSVTSSSATNSAWAPVTGLIAASIVLIAVSTASLAYGWIEASSAFIWGSIAASVGCAVCLALAYYRSRAEAASESVIEDPARVRVRPAPSGGPATEEIALFDPDSGMESDHIP